MIGLLHGSLKGLSTMNERKKAFSYGRMGIVRFSLFSLPLSLMASGFVAGSGKSILWWVTPQPTCANVADVGGQFFGRRGRQIHTFNRISFSRLLLS